MAALIELEPKQLHMAEHKLRVPRNWDQSDPGAGKTLACIHAYARGRAEGLITGRCLVLAPKTILETSWGDDIDKYNASYGTQLTYRVAHAGKDRLANLSAEADFVLTNHDAVKFCQEHYARLRQCGFEWLIIDEITAFKNITSQRTKAMLFVRNLFERRTGMSGNANAKTNLDVFAPTLILDDGEHLGKSFFKFRPQIATFQQNGPDPNHGKWVDKPDASETVAQAIADMTVRYPLVLNARNEVVTYHVTLPPKVLAAYEQMKDMSVVQTDDGQMISAVHAGVKLNKMLQICIAESTPVLTDEGWVPIEQIQPHHCLWDGHAWVTHGGLIYQGDKPVVECYGVQMTPGHRVLTTEGWREAQEVLHGNASERLDRATVRLPDGYHPPGVERGVNNREKQAGSLGMPLRLWKHDNSRQPKPAVEAPAKRETLWVSARRAHSTTRYEPAAALSHLARHERTLHEAGLKGLAQLWWAGYHSLRNLVGLFRDFLGRHGTRVCLELILGSSGQRWPLLTGELSLGHCARADQQHPRQSLARNSRGQDDHCPGRKALWVDQKCPLCPPLLPTLATRSGAVNTAIRATFDILNVGQHNQFVVKGADGRPLIVHNCTGSVYDGDGNAHIVHTDRAELVMEHVLARQHTLVAYNWQHELAQLEKLAAKHKLRYGVINGKTPNARRTQIVRDMQAGLLDTVFAHPKSAAHGLTFTRCSATIWMSPCNSPEFFQQFNARVHRKGQTKDNQSIRIAAKNTKEEAVYEALDQAAMSATDLWLILAEVTRQEAGAYA